MKDFAITNSNHSNLDGLRAIGILMVLAKHFFGQLINLQFCWTGIDLLFALSGLLITGILIETKQDRKYFQKFYMRRILRIFPLYYFLVIVFTIYIYFITKQTGVFQYYKDHIGFFYTYTQNWSYIYYGIPAAGHLNHTWTLAIDEQIYIFWPMLIWLCKSQKQLMYLCGGLLTFSLCFRIGYNMYLTHYPSPDAFAYIRHTLCRMDSFGAGSLLYCLIRFQHKWITSKKMIYLSFASLLLFMLFVILDGSADFTGYFMRNFGITVAGIHFTTWLYFAIAKKSQLLNTIFSSRILIYIGKISYSLYVYHWFLLILLLPKINQLLLANFQIKSLLPGLIICLLITFIVSMLSYKYFEKPIIKIKRKFSYR